MHGKIKSCIPIKSTGRPNALTTSSGYPKYELRRGDRKKLGECGSKPDINQV